MLLPGEALRAEVLSRVAKGTRFRREGEGESMRGGMNPLSLGGSGDLPRIFFQNICI